MAKILVNFWIDEEDLNHFDLLCKLNRVTRSERLRQFIRDEINTRKNICELCERFRPENHKQCESRLWELELNLDSSMIWDNCKHRIHTEFEILVAST